MVEVVGGVLVKPLWWSLVVRHRGDDLRLITLRSVNTWILHRKVVLVHLDPQDRYYVYTHHNLWVLDPTHYCGDLYCPGWTFLDKPVVGGLSNKPITLNLQ